MRARVRILPALLLATLALAAGCDYFRPEDPPAPDPGDLIAQDYSNAEATLETIRQAVEAKGLKGGAEAYANAFSDSIPPSTPGFFQYFWPADEAAWEAAGNEVPDWDKAAERLFYNIGPRSLVNLRDEDYRMTWDPEPGNPDEPGDQFIVVHRRYRIDAVGVAGTAVEIIAKGYADIVLTRLEDGNWKLTRWQDRADPEIDPELPEQRTWGQRRLESR